MAAGGDKGLSEEENTEFYWLRLGMALRLIHSFHGGQRPLRLLDAGCGNGQLSGPLRECGHSVVGVDGSPTAIRQARQAWPQVTFHCVTLEDLALERLFDVVLAVDVLFHIVDDTAWEAALVRLTGHCKTSGTLLLTDTWQPTRYPMSNYIVHRSLPQYEDVLGPLGWHIGEIVPYAYGGNPNGFAAFRRSS